MMTRTFRLTADSQDALQRAENGIKNISFGRKIEFEFKSQPKILGVKFEPITIIIKYDDDKDVEKAIEIARLEAQKHGAQLSHAEPESDPRSSLARSGFSPEIFKDFLDIKNRRD